MNRKNLTAAVLAGLAGVAGMAGAAQAGITIAEPVVNLNPDGLGQVLVYPYYTTNDNNTTLVTVVNTTSDAKAVKVRFLEGFNSREVLDFNLYLSEYDVWVAAIADSAAFGAAAGVPHLFTPDRSCTVPYIFEDAYVEALGGGLQEFLDYAYTGDYEDGGPSDISRASEGYLEMIEMGTMIGGDAFFDTNGKKIRIDSLEALTHVVKEDDDGNEYDDPEDCQILVENWTEYLGAVKPPTGGGFWLDEALDNCGKATISLVDPDKVGDKETQCGQADSSTGPNSGGLFGGAAIINVPKGTMFSYDAKAIQGFDTTDNGIHFYPGTIHPSLNDGSSDVALVMAGGWVPWFVSNDESEGRTVDAVSAVFMHDTLANTFVIEEDIAAATEWVMTLPTKAWYVDTALTGLVETYYEPSATDDDCFDWDPKTDPNPFTSDDFNGGTYDKVCSAGSGDWGDDNWAPGCDFPDGYPACTPVKVVDTDSFAPFTEAFDGKSCDEVTFEAWNREESPTVAGGAIRPPVVSPAPPSPPDSKEVPFELCYEVNVLRFGEGSVFGTESDLLYTVEGTPTEGWARIRMGGELEMDGYSPLWDWWDDVTLVGLPITGFSAEQYTNGQLAGGVLANYGGLFSHKGSTCVIPDDAAREIDFDCDSSWLGVVAID